MSPRLINARCQHVEKILVVLAPAFRGSDPSAQTYVQYDTAWHECWCGGQPLRRNVAAQLFMAAYNIGPKSRTENNISERKHLRSSLLTKGDIGLSFVHPLSISRHIDWCLKETLEERGNTEAINQIPELRKTLVVPIKTLLAFWTTQADDGHRRG